MLWENCPFIDNFPSKTSIYKGFYIAMLNNQTVHIFFPWSAVSTGAVAAVAAKTGDDAKTGARPPRAAIPSRLCRRTAGGIRDKVRGIIWAKTLPKTTHLGMVYNYCI